MSVHTQVTVFCDAVGCDALDGVDQPGLTASQIRQMLRATEGWHALPGGRDICGDCWAEGLR